MNALKIAIHNRNSALELYNSALIAHAERPWDKKLKAVLALAAAIYRDADAEVRAAPGYLESFK